MNTVISVRIDKETKDAAQEVAKSAGVSLSTIINAYLRQLIATRRIELFAPEPMTPKLEKLIGKVEAEINSGQVSQTFETADEFLSALKSK